jgi:hypothetical protein
VSLSGLLTPPQSLVDASRLALNRVVSVGNRKAREGASRKSEEVVLASSLSGSACQSPASKGSRPSWIESRLIQFTRMREREVLPPA